MAELKYAEVSERVEWLESDAGLKELKARAKNSWDPLTKMTYVPNLPDHMTRRITVAMNSPRLIDLRDGLVSDMASYKAIVGVQPFGKNGAPTQEDKDRADTVERGMAVVRARFNEGGKLRTSMLTQQLLGPYFVAIMSVGDPTGDFPWEVLIPDIHSCSFPVKAAPYRPPMMARRYRQLVRDAERAYSQRPRTARYDANLRRRNGKWMWEPLGDDVDSQGGSIRTGGDPKYGEECEFIWYDDGEYVYHIALNEDKTGEVVYCEKNLVGGCSALVVSGRVTEYRDARDRLGPALMPILQTTLNRNLVRSMRATASMNAKPDVIVEMTPEAFTQARDAGMLTQVQLEEGNPNLVHVGGKPTPWVIQPNLDLDKLDEGWKEEEMEYVSAWKEPTDPSTVSDARANTYLTAVEAIRRRQTPLLKDGDWLEANLLKMVVHSIKELDREFTFRASSGVGISGGEMGAGTAVTIGPANLDFDFDVTVTTKATTDSEMRARHDFLMLKVADGTGTLEEVIEAEYPDATAQIERLAIDSGYRLKKGEMVAYADASWRDIVKTEQGIMLPVAGDALVQESTTAPGGVTPMQPAAIGGPAGGAGVAA